MDQPAVGKPLKWYQGLEKYCWVVLVISALGWLFDTMDQNLFNLVRRASVEELVFPHKDRLKLKPEERNKTLTPDERKAFEKDVKQVSGWVTSIFLYGWAAGGFIFGILGDRLGRTKTMIITILIYAVFTGASGFVNNWQLYAIARFMTGLGVGGEWAAGAALVAETFPQRSRPMALGFLQALSSVGNMMAACITWGIEGAGISDVQPWRIVYFVGAVPALLVLWIRRSVREPEQWVHAKERASVGKEMGKIGELFSHPVLRRNLIASVLMGSAGVATLWGVGFFSTDFVLGELTAAQIPLDSRNQTKNIMFLLQNLGSFFGIYSFALLAEKIGRKKAFYLSYALAWASILMFFWSLAGAGAKAQWLALVLAPIMGFCTLMPFSGFTIYFPELFPTRLRTTGCGFAYNAARVLAANAPPLLTSLAASLAVYDADGKLIKGGFAPAASIVVCIYVVGFIGTMLGPETKGKPLPDDKDFETSPRVSAAPAPQQT